MATDWGAQIREDLLRMDQDREKMEVWHQEQAALIEKAWELAEIFPDLSNQGFIDHVRHSEKFVKNLRNIMEWRYLVQREIDFRKILQTA